MDDRGRQREAHLQTLQAELEAERRLRLAAEAEAVAAQAAGDELLLQVQRAGLDSSIRTQRLFRAGARVLLVMLVIALAATATVGIAYYWRVGRQLTFQLSEAKELRQRRAREQGLDRERCRQRERAIATELRDCQENANRNKAQGWPHSTTVAGDETLPSLGVRALLAYKGKQHRACMELARRALRIDPKNQPAIRLLGLCACGAEDRASAIWARDRLDPEHLGSLRAICAREGIDLRPAR